MNPLPCRLFLVERILYTDREIVMLTKAVEKFHDFQHFRNVIRCRESSTTNIHGRFEAEEDREELIFQWRFLDNAEEIAIAVDEKEDSLSEQICYGDSWL